MGRLAPYCYWLLNWRRRYGPRLGLRGCRGRVLATGDHKFESRLGTSVCAPVKKLALLASTECVGYMAESHFPASLAPRYPYEVNPVKKYFTVLSTTSLKCAPLSGCPCHTQSPHPPSANPVSLIFKLHPESNHFKPSSLPPLSSVAWIPVLDFKVIEIPLGDAKGWAGELGQAAQVL
uniref:Uncharacterized protein n=1 Tax=Mustela putorius furo TaxID=9669 RepID=M3YQD5_MUSPF